METHETGVEAARRTVNQLVWRARNHHDTGFVSCQYKHELLELKWYIEDALDQCPNFGGIEEEWQKQRVLQLLKK
jgi:hypothetical protein